MSAQACITILDQVGRMNLLAISGGRYARVAEMTISLPVRYGYFVEIEYIAGSDLYEVRRMFRRGARTSCKGAQSGIHAEQLGEAAYRASCYSEEF